MGGSAGLAPRPLTFKENWSLGPWVPGWWCGGSSHPQPGFVNENKRHRASQVGVHLQSLRRKFLSSPPGEVPKSAESMHFPDAYFSKEQPKSTRFDFAHSRLRVPRGAWGVGRGGGDVTLEACRAPSAKAPKAPGFFCWFSSERGADSGFLSLRSPSVFFLNLPFFIVHP